MCFLMYFHQKYMFIGNINNNCVITTYSILKQDCIFAKDEPKWKVKNMVKITDKVLS